MAKQTFYLSISSLMTSAAIRDREEKGKKKGGRRKKKHTRILQHHRLTKLPAPPSGEKRKKKGEDNKTPRTFPFRSSNLFHQVLKTGSRCRVRTPPELKKREKKGKKKKKKRGENSGSHRNLAARIAP